MLCDKELQLGAARYALAIWICTRLYVKIRGEPVIGESINRFLHGCMFEQHEAVAK